jgi:hypothetical protein
MLSEHGGFMPDCADDKGEKLAGTPQAIWARQIHAGTALRTRARVAGPPQAVWDSCRHGIDRELKLGETFLNPC